MTLPAQRRRAADETADRIRVRILRGDFVAGSLLPPERELAEDLGISRLTLRSALARLETQGLVRPVHGSGNRVLDYRASGGVDLLGDLAALAWKGGEAPVALFHDLLELRRMLAVEVVGLAAERATEADLERIAAALDELPRHLGDPAAFMAAELRFVRAMIGASGNVALELLGNTLERLLESQPGIEAAFALDAPGAVAVYREILGLLQRREAALARESARRLLGHLDETLIGRVRALTGKGENP